MLTKDQTQGPTWREGGIGRPRSQNVISVKMSKYLVSRVIVIV